MELTDDQIVTMLGLQDSINSMIDPDWRASRHEWYRATWVECAELMDHIGWKWWKLAKPDRKQIELELVDIWHFGLSDLLQEHGLNAAAATIADAQRDPPHPPSSPEVQRTCVEELARTALSNKRFPLRQFFIATTVFNLDGPTLFDTYVKKNVLNRFRQDHGYADGTYRKIWGGKEDNECLSKISLTLSVSFSQLPDALYQALEAEYAKH